MLNKFVRINVKITEIIVTRLHSLKPNVEKEWEEKYLGFLPDHIVIWLAFGLNKGQFGERNFFSLTVFGGNIFSRWCTLKRDNGYVFPNVTVDRHYVLTYLRLTMVLLLRLYSEFPTAYLATAKFESSHWKVFHRIDVPKRDHLKIFVN